MKNIIKPVLILTVILLIYFTGMGTGYFLEREINSVPTPTPINQTQYTGQELFEAVNNYRISKNLNPIKLSKTLCNGIVDRYLMIVSEKGETEGHPGFKEWVDKKAGKSNLTWVAELFTGDYTLDEAIKGLADSPSHRLNLEGNFTEGCTYVGSRGGVIVLGR